jgi:hypothetical protein
MNCCRSTAFNYPNDYFDSGIGAFPCRQGTLSDGAAHTFMVSRVSWYISDKLSLIKPWMQGINLSALVDSYQAGAYEMSFGDYIKAEAEKVRVLGDDEAEGQLGGLWLVWMLFELNFLGFSNAGVQKGTFFTGKK